MTTTFQAQVAALEQHMKTLAKTGTVFVTQGWEVVGVSEMAQEQGIAIAVTNGGGGWRITQTKETI